MKRSRIVKDVLRNTKDGVSDWRWKRLVDYTIFVSEPQAATETVAKSLFLIKSNVDPPASPRSKRWETLMPKPFDATMCEPFELEPAAAFRFRLSRPGS